MSNTNCPVYKEYGCGHVDGYHCHLDTCTIVENYRASRENPNREVINDAEEYVEHELRRGIRRTRLIKEGRLRF